MQVFEDFDLESNDAAQQQYSFVKDNFGRKIKSVKDRIPFLRDVVALYRFMTDPQAAWYDKGLVIGALTYFIVPLDAIPDIAPFVGFLDDLGVIAFVVRHLGGKLKPYYL